MRLPPPEVGPMCTARLSGPQEVSVHGGVLGAGPETQSRGRSDQQGSCFQEGFPRAEEMDSLPHPPTIPTPGFWGVSENLSLQWANSHLHLPSRDPPSGDHLQEACLGCQEWGWAASGATQQENPILPSRVPLRGAFSQGRWLGFGEGDNLVSQGPVTRGTAV